ncbi:type II toxin-antitoxin system VapC family toxin [Nakamurella sp. GG22]
MTDLVIDASALAFALIGVSPEAADLRARLMVTQCHAPHLIDAELGNVLRRRVRMGDITSDQALVALATATDAVDHRYSHAGALAAVAWSLRDNLSFYDGLYVALAARLDIPLLTGDRRIGKAPGLPCVIQTL